MYADVRQYNNKRRLMAALMREALKTYDDESSLFAGLPDLLAGMLLEDSAVTISSTTTPSRTWAPRLGPRTPWPWRSSSCGTS